MKQIEGKSRRVLKYDRMFFWYVPLCAAFFIALGLYAYGWDFRILVMVVPGIMIGGVLGVLLRDVP